MKWLRGLSLIGQLAGGLRGVGGSLGSDYLSVPAEGQVPEQTIGRGLPLTSLTKRATGPAHLACWREPAPAKARSNFSLPGP
ncbi:hypothetical protein AAFF_G00397650 [Aldrovandia affinis]|uniref:Uncharacterized protein n=1 Tax=Aldrovandia affinis TaxID=143900 RepID=A0AAD7SD35_9TELE|nr:hypothetical protein AAFF_G00397650 [Aldrovandia affinis]